MDDQTVVLYEKLKESDEMQYTLPAYYKPFLT